MIFVTPEICENAVGMFARRMDWDVFGSSEQ